MKNIFLLLLTCLLLSPMSGYSQAEVPVEKFPYSSERLSEYLQNRFPHEKLKLEFKNLNTVDHLPERVIVTDRVDAGFLGMNDCWSFRSKDDYIFGMQIKGESIQEYVDPSVRTKIPDFDFTMYVRDFGTHMSIHYLIDNEYIGHEELEESDLDQELLGESLENNKRNWRELCDIYVNLLSTY